MLLVELDEGTRYKRFESMSVWKMIVLYVIMWCYYKMKSGVPA